MKAKSMLILKRLEKRANMLLHRNYKKLFNKKYEIQIIENVMCNDTCHFVAVFKDYLIADDNSEYLRRIYKKNESIQRLTKLFSYYQETSIIFPNYTPLIESKYLYNNVIRKQRVIDEQQNLEEYKKYLNNKEKKKDKKTSPLKKIENVFEQDTYVEEGTKVFNSKAYDEILNASESIKRIIFGIETNKNNNCNNNENINEKDSVKELLMKLDDYENKKNKNIEPKKKLEYEEKLLCKNKRKTNSKSTDKNNIIKNKKEHSSSFKKNRTININININNTKNNYAMTERPLSSNINNIISHNVINDNFPISIKGKLKEKNFIFNKKTNSTFPYQMFRNANLISNLNKNKNNKTSNNSINALQQKLMEIFNKKIKKYKSGNRNNSYNLSLSKTSNTSRLRTKTKAFIINTIQSSILNSKPKKNTSNLKSDKNMSVNKRKKSKKSNDKNGNSANHTNHKRMKSHIIYIKNSNIENDIFSKTKKDLKTYYINKPLLTITPSLKKRNIFGFKTMSKLTETDMDKTKKKNNDKNGNYNDSLKNRCNIQNKDDINNKIFSYKAHNIKNTFSNNNSYNYKFKYI